MADTVNENKTNPEETVVNTEEKSTKEKSASTKKILSEIDEVAKKIVEKAQIEIDKAEEGKYIPKKFSKEFKRKAENIKEHTILERIEGILKQEYNFDVKIINDIDIKDVTDPKILKYYIQITNKEGIVIKIKVDEYQNSKDDSINGETELIINKLGRLNGYTNLNTDRAAAYIADYIALLLAFENEKNHLKYSAIGWDIVRKQIVFKYDKLYSNIENLWGFCDAEWAEAIKLKQSEDTQEEARSEWINQVKSVMNGRPKAAILLCAAASGMVRQLLTDQRNTNIDINIIGEPKSGKTTMETLVLSFFGDPNLLMGTFTDTDNAVENLRVDRAVLPFVIDERMMKTALSSNRQRAVKTIIDVFRESEGKVKSRFGSKDNSRRAYGALIGSSVESIYKLLEKYFVDENGDIKDIGQYRRLIELDVEAGELFENAAQAKEVSRLAGRNYGYGVRMMADCMLEMLKNEEDIENNMAGNLEEKIAFLSEPNDETNVIKKDTLNMGYSLFDDLLDLAIEEVEDIINALYRDKDNAEIIKEELEAYKQRFALLYMTGLIINTSFGRVEEYIEEEIINESIEEMEEEESEEESVDEQTEEERINKLVESALSIKTYPNYIIDVDSMIEELVNNAIKELGIDKKMDEPTDELSTEELEDKIIQLYKWFIKVREEVENSYKQYKDKDFVVKYGKSDEIVFKAAIITGTKQDARKVSIGVLLANVSDELSIKELSDFENSDAPRMGKYALSYSEMERVYKTGLIKEIKKRYQIHVGGDAKNGKQYVFDVVNINKLMEEREKSCESVGNEGKSDEKVGVEE